MVAKVNKNNLFEFYEGFDPALYTALTGVNLNANNAILEQIIDNQNEFIDSSKSTKDLNANSVVVGVNGASKKLITITNINPVTAAVQYDRYTAKFPAPVADEECYLKVDGLGEVRLSQYGPNGTLVDPRIYAGTVGSIVFDGTQYILESSSKSLDNTAPTAEYTFGNITHGTDGVSYNPSGTKMPIITNTGVMATPAINYAIADATATGNFNLRSSGTVASLKYITGNGSISSTGWISYALSTDSSYNIAGLDGVKRLILQSTGLNINGTIYATGNITAYSDPRLKTNIAPLEGALSIINQLNPKSYKWLAEDEIQVLEDKSKISGLPTGTDYGLLSSEVKALLPELVSTSEATGYDSVAYLKLVPFLIKAVQELSQQVEELKAAQQ